MSVFSKSILFGLAVFLTGGFIGESARAQNFQDDWEGVWAGGSIGWKWLDTEFQGSPDDFAVPPELVLFFDRLSTGAPVSKSGDLSADGVTVGGLLGVNRRRGAWVFGIEGAADFADVEESVTRSASSIADYNGTAASEPDFARRNETCRNSTDMSFEASLTGRLGYLISPRTQVFVRAGLAAAAVEREADCFSTTEFIDGNGGLIATHTSRARAQSDELEMGYTVGAGFVKLIREGRWRARFDYSWVDLGSSRQTATVTRTSQVTALAGGTDVPNEGPETVQYEWEEDYHKVRFSLIYKFGRPAPTPFK